VLVVSELASRLSELRPHHNQPASPRDVHRFQEQRFDDAERRGARADSQRQR
jgi:hypothetical protein